MQPKLAIALLLSPTLLTAQSCPQVQALLKDPAVAAAHWGISVTTLTGTPLCQINEAQLFRPASNAKLFTAAAALALLGPDSQAYTYVSVSTQGGRDDSSKASDLLLRGTGDSFLSHRTLSGAASGSLAATQPSASVGPLESLADQVAASGLKHITGNIVGDDTDWPYEPYPDEWALGDTLWGYGAPVSALSVFDNQVTLTVTPGSATFEPATPFYQVDSQVAAGPAKTASAMRIERQPGSRVVRLAGTVAPGQPFHEELAVSDPAEYAALTFKTLLKARGIVVDGQAVARHRAPADTDSFRTQVNRPLVLPQSQLQSQPAPQKPATLRLPPGPVLCALDACRDLALHTSPTLAEDVTVTLKQSLNLHAELFLHRLGKQFADDGSTAQGSRVVRQFLVDTGIRPGDVFLSDGSGLSTQDLITPRAATTLLTWAARQPWFNSYKFALPIGGVDGTLSARFLTTLKGRVFAKTGTLGESRALSGYLTAASGQTLVFSILADTHLPGSTADRATTDKILELFAAAN